MITSEQAEDIKIRTYIITLLSCGKPVSIDYNRKLDPRKNKELLRRDLVNVISFCDILELYSKNSKEAYKIYKYVIKGFEKVYSDDERKEIINLIKNYRIPFDKINRCEKITDLEYLVLMIAGDFFEEIHIKTRDKLPRLKPENKAIEAVA